MRLSSGLKQARLLIAMLAGTAIYAFGLHYFLLPNQLMEGGVTGIALLLNYAIGWPLSLSTLLINIPLFAIGLRLLGWRPMVYTLIGTLALSSFLLLMEQLIALGWLVPFYTEHDYMLSALYAGVTLGTGLGIVFRCGGTTGGSDIIARILSRRRGWSMGQIILGLDAIIIGSSLFYIPKEKILYTLVAVFIATKMIDFIQEGAYAAKAFTIIAADGEQLAARITAEMERGVTLLPAIGAFSRHAKHVVYCVVARHEIRRLKKIVREMDPHAFIVINDVQDVLGEGFKAE